MTIEQKVAQAAAQFAQMLAVSDTPSTPTPAAPVQQAPTVEPLTFTIEDVTFLSKWTEKPGADGKRHCVTLANIPGNPFRAQGFDKVFTAILQFGYTYPEISRQIVAAARIHGRRWVEEQAQKAVVS